MHYPIIAVMRGSHGLSARRAWRTLSSRPEGPKAGPKDRSLEVGARRAPRLLVNTYLNRLSDATGGSNKKKIFSLHKIPNSLKLWQKLWFSSCWNHSMKTWWQDDLKPAMPMEFSENEIEPPTWSWTSYLINISILNVDLAVLKLNMSQERVLDTAKV